MASAWSEEETFACSVCLDTLKDPATLPCGHSYCLSCIQRHWDKKDRNGQYSCPQCRQIFSPRPSLGKSTVLVEAMEKLRTSSLKQSSFTAVSSAPPSMPIYLEVLPDTAVAQDSIYPQLPTMDPRRCPQHNCPLDLFCHEDRECVCEMCCLHGHKGHRVLNSQEERKERQKEFIQMQVDVQKRMQDTEKKLNELRHFARQRMATLQALEQNRTELFTELAKHVNQTGTQIGELLNTYETSLSSQIEGQIHRLEQEVTQLRWRNEELGRLADMQDNICFLKVVSFAQKNFLTMEPLGQVDAIGDSMLNQKEVVVASICSTMKELQESIQDLCKASLTKIITLTNQVSVAPVSNCAAADITAANESAQANAQNTGHQDSFKYPSIPLVCLQASAPLAPSPPLQSQVPPIPVMGLFKIEPKTREELLKFRFEPTMDPNTVYRHVLLSDGDRKATMRAENLHPPDNPERFHFWRQVLCREPLAGSPYYWEMEWTGEKITIGLAYKEMERKGFDDKSRLGHNALSWSLNWSGSGFSFWHDSQEKLLGSPKARRIGVYLDQHEGCLAFYRIANNQADLIYQHRAQFTGPLFLGFRFSAGVGAKLTICQLD